MKCKEILFNLEPYLAGELCPAAKTAVEEHLGACRSCRLELAEMKDKINWIRQGREDFTVTMPAPLRKRLFLRFHRETGVKRMILGRYATAAAIAVAVVLATVFSSTIAQFMEDIPFIRKYFSFGDKGIEHSLSLGAGQYIEESKTVDGITVTIHRLIADKNQTVVLYSISSEAEADTAYIGHTLLDSKGRPVGTSGTHRFHEDLGKVTGQIRAVNIYEDSRPVGVDELGEQIQIRFHRIAFQKTYTREVSFSAAGRINLVIPLVDVEGRTVGEYILESAEVKGSDLHLTARYTMQVDPRVFDGPMSDSGGQNYANPQIVSLYQGETPLSLSYGSFKSGGYDEYTYSLDQAGGSDFRLVLAFEQPAAIAGEIVAFQIQIDRELAARNTFEKEIGQRVDLEEGIYINFKRLVATASMTTIEYQVQPVQEEKSGGYLIPDVELTLSSDGTRIEYHSTIRDLASGLFVISIDPAIPLDTLSISVDGYYRRVFAPLELSLRAADEGKTFSAGGSPLTVDGIDLDVNPGIEAGEDWVGPFVMISISSPAVAGFDDVTVSDSTGTREVLYSSHYLMWSKPPWRKRDRHYSYILFSSSDTEWLLTAGSYVQYIEKNITITP